MAGICVCVLATLSIPVHVLHNKYHLKDDHIMVCTTKKAFKCHQTLPLHRVWALPLHRGLGSGNETLWVVVQLQSDKVLCAWVASLVES